MKKTNLEKERIKALEKKLKAKEDLLKKYREALDYSSARIKQITRDVNESLSLVREIHKSLLPTKLPRIPGFDWSYKFLPTQKGVSGDFFNVVKIKNSMKFGILLASCSTYTIASLFVSSFLKSSPDLQNNKTAKDFLSFVAKNISSFLLKKEKIHLFYGIVSRRTLEMDYCLVGDIFFAHKTHGKDFEILPSYGSHLYEKPTPQLKSGKRVLQAKDLLLLCSPGVAERTNKKGEKFGVDNIIKAVSEKYPIGVLETRQKILFSSKAFGGKSILEKDSTILAIQTTGPHLKLS